MEEADENAQYEKARDSVEDIPPLIDLEKHNGETSINNYSSALMPDAPLKCRRSSTLPFSIKTALLMCIKRPSRQRFLSITVRGLFVVVVRCLRCLRRWAVF
jgi:hypothetical protein